jgi:hypothetical protein
VSYPLPKLNAMPSTLAWLDHDTSARERTKRILALFQERGTVDQLGLGGIRDSFADLMFPGTSTIQTRLRYFLFVPWIYTRLEQDEVPASRFAAAARSAQLALVVPLLEAREEGIFGKRAGGDLKRLPADVYWGGLRSWGIWRPAAAGSGYHRAVDEIYRRRRQARRTTAEGTEAEAGTRTWHPDLPAPPSTFPDQMTLAVTAEEAEFLRDRIVAEHPSSLLAWLALHGDRTDTPTIWDHPLAPIMPPALQDVIRHARLFSHVMLGAPILFNRMLSEEASRQELVTEYVEAFEEWAASLDRDEIDAWPLVRLFKLARAQPGRTVTAQAEEFVSRWVAMVREDPFEILGRADAHSMIRHREVQLKGARSFFRNPRALEERYSGGVGMGRMAFRWPNVQVLLNDLHDGLAGG